MKIAAQTSVTLARNVTDPRPPNTEVLLPPPSAAMASPFPGWRRITKMRKTLTTTCSAMMNQGPMGRRTLHASGPTRNCRRPVRNRSRYRGLQRLQVLDEVALFGRREGERQGGVVVSHHLVERGEAAVVIVAPL